MSFDKREYQRQYMARKRAESNSAESNNGQMLDGWTWDIDHIYLMCPHGKRYCSACGTTVQRPTYTPEQWTEAYKRIQAGKRTHKPVPE